MKKVNTKNQIIIYQAPSGAIELKGDVKRETVWATQRQLAEVFKVDVRTINEHLKNIFKFHELKEKSVIRKFRITASDGKIYNTNHYNLDAIISVGYRVNSKTATQFRQWATKTLREHIVIGYTINRKQVMKNYNAFIKTVGDIQALLPEHIALDPKSVLELVKEFSNTWQSLDAYDKESLKKIGATKKSVKISTDELLESIAILRQDLIKRGETTDIFAHERSPGSIEGIVGNVVQSFNGKPVYPTIEEKAAHLLYFMVKNHPFTDGNKRSGAFAFIWFLRKARSKRSRNINPAALTALTLLIAESNPTKKDQMIALITQLLK
ncbi:MAG: virulence RhuM family protein [Parcubacteria group bacterium]|nr:virulence RhuM family protein [Parcubacteria group bacterium]MCR4342371.1 virulence RhuM family protein [Patescibacteria group bacterium]